MGKESSPKNNVSEKLSAPHRLEKAKAKELAKQFNVVEDEEYFSIAIPSGDVIKMPKWESVPVVAGEKNGKQEFKNIPIEKALEATVKHPDKDLNEALKLLEEENKNEKPNSA